jgi:NADH-quinone oxidoreductase subunit N
MRKAVAATAAFAGFAVAAGCAFFVFDRTHSPEVLLDGSMVRDQLAAMAQVILGVTGAAVVFASWGERRRLNHAEYYALLATAGAGMAFFVSADNLMTLLPRARVVLALPLHPRCVRQRARDLARAGLKYLVVGGFGSAVLLFGSALVYGATGQLSFQDIASTSPDERGVPLRRARDAPRRSRLQGLGCALPHVDARRVPGLADLDHRVHVRRHEDRGARRDASSPRHGLPGPERRVDDRRRVLAAISLAWGNLGALAQRDLKRILAYSSISHAGFLLMAVSANSERGGEALLYYLVVYSAMSVGAFAVVAARERELQAPVTLESLAGFGWSARTTASRCGYSCSAWPGFPLTGGLFGKFFVFSAAYDAGEWWLVLIGVAATAVSLAYYLNVVRWMYMRSSTELTLAVAGGSPPRDSALGVRDKCCRRRHRRFVLRSAAHPRRRLRRGGIIALLMATELTWLGHATFRVDSPGGKRIYVDPFLHGNPKCPPGEVEPKRCDLILVTHGHGDHLGDTIRDPPAARFARWSHRSSCGAGSPRTASPTTVARTRSTRRAPARSRA